MQHFVNERRTVGYFSGDEDKMDEQALKLKFQLNDSYRCVIIWIKSSWS